MPSIQSDTEWTVIISKFESFNKFYVQKVEGDYSSTSAVKFNNLSTSVVADKSKGSIRIPPVGSIVETLTDKEDGEWYKAEVMATDDGPNIIVRVLNDGSICKSTKIKDLPDNGEKSVYHCCLEEDPENDNIVNDPFNFKLISNILTSREWTMKMLSDREPYKVILSINGEDCIDVICSLLPPIDARNIKNSKNINLSLNVDGPEDKGAIIIKEKPKNDVAKKNDTENDLVIPHTETVTIRNFETYKSFQAVSECLLTLYLDRINAELKECKTKKPTIKYAVGSILVAYCKNLDRCYRVLIEAISPHSTNCYLLDYGDYDVFKEFYQPTDFLCTCPSIVRRCSLYAPKLAGKEDEFWFPDVDDVFKDILSCDGVKFNMTIKANKKWPNLCKVKLLLGSVDLSEMLCPINVRVTHVKSLTDFKIRAISSEHITVTELLETGNVPEVVVENPVQGSLYLTKINSKLARVKFDSFDVVKYLVNDIDDTRGTFSVHELYEIPESISNIPFINMACSLILHDDEDAYSLNAFKCMANKKVVFVMSIINEKNDPQPSLVKLYYANTDVLSILKSYVKKN